ncbi:unnamed protein product [Ixodes pacificus]
MTIPISKAGKRKCRLVHVRGKTNSEGTSGAEVRSSCQKVPYCFPHSGMRLQNLSDQIHSVRPINKTGRNRRKYRWPGAVVSISDRLLENQKFKSWRRKRFVFFGGCVTVILLNR